MELVSFTLDNEAGALETAGWSVLFGVLQPWVNERSFSFIDAGAVDGEVSLGLTSSSISTLDIVDVVFEASTFALSSGLARLASFSDSLFMASYAAISSLYLTLSISAKSSNLFLSAADNALHRSPSKCPNSPNLMLGHSATILGRSSTMKNV